MVVRRPQITIGRLMILVAVVGVMAWGGVWAYRRWMLAPAFRHRARYHAQHEKTTIIGVREPSHTADATELAALTRTWQAYHSTMRQKYERAAACPWLPLPDDPPSPVGLSDAATGRSVDLHYP